MADIVITGRTNMVQNGSITVTVTGQYQVFYIYYRIHSVGGNYTTISPVNSSQGSRGSTYEHSFTINSSTVESSVVDEPYFIMQGSNNGRDWYNIDGTQVTYSIEIRLYEAFWDVEPTFYDLEWTGTRQELIASTGSAVYGIRYFKLDNSSYTAIPSEIYATDIGAYTVYYYLAGESSDYADSDVQSSVVNIYLPDPELIDPPIYPSSLTYTGNNQYLLSDGGTVRMGILKYCSIKQNTQPTTPSYPGTGITWYDDYTDITGLYRGNYWVYYCILYENGNLFSGPTLVESTSIYMQGLTPSWSYSLSRSTINIYESTQLTIVASSSQYSSISIATNFVDISITHTGLVYTLTAGATSGTATIFMTLIGNDVYETDTKTTTLIITDAQWSPATPYRFDKTQNKFVPFTIKIWDENSNDWVIPQIFIHD